MDEKQLEKLEEVLKKIEAYETLGGDVPTTKEVVELFEAVLKVVKELKDTLLQKVEDSSSEMSDKYSEAIKVVESLEERMGKKNAKMSEEMDEMAKKIFQSIAEVKSLISPITDLSPLEKRVGEVEKKIPTIPDEITPEVVKNKMESLEGEDRLDKSSIKGLDEELKRLDSKPTGSRGGARKITYVKRYNLTSQLNGVLKTFTLPADTIEVIGVWGTEFPINFNPGTDWTFSGRTLTLTSEVSAPQTGQTLYCLIETLFYG